MKYSDLDFRSLSSINRVGIVGGSGSGKSNAVWILIEELRKKKMPVVILDSSNDYLDIRKRGNFKVVKAKKISAGKLPSKIRRTHQSYIVTFKKMHISDRRKWFINFLDGCFNKINKKPAIVVIDECHKYIPQSKSRNKLLNECRELGNQLLSEGRKFGWGSIIISQRPTKIDKDSLAECDHLMVMRHTLENDIKRLKGMIGKYGIDVETEIPSLKTGEVFHIDLENFKMNKYRFKKAKGKMLGRTPKPVGVDPIKDNWFLRMKDFDFGIENEDIKLVVTVITILAAIIISLAILEKLNEDEIIETE